MRQLLSVGVQNSTFWRSVRCFPDNIPVCLITLNQTDETLLSITSLWTYSNEKSRSERLVATENIMHKGRDTFIVTYHYFRSLSYCVGEDIHDV
jgi:hypothetical protein